MDVAEMVVDSGSEISDNEDEPSVPQSYESSEEDFVSEDEVLMQLQGKTALLDGMVLSGLE